MLAMVLWTLATAIQIVALVLAFSLVRQTRNQSIRWVFGIALVLLAVWRLENLVSILGDSSPPRLASPLEATVAILSLLAAASIAWLRRPLGGMRDSSHALKESEDALCANTSQQARLLEVARQLNSSLDLQEVLRVIASEAKSILGAFGCTVYLLDQASDMLLPVVAIDPEYEQEIMSTPVRVDGSFTGQSIRALAPLMFNDAGANDTGFQIPGTPEDEAEHIIAAPFIVDEQVLGAICANRLGIGFAQADLALAETFATYAATALKNAQVHERLRHEVEERTRAERELAQQKAYFQQLFDNSPEAIAVVERGSRVVLVNEQFTQLFGYAASEAVGQEIDRLIIPANLKEEAFQATLRCGRGERLSFETTRVHRDGTPVDVAVLATPIRTGDGGMVSFAIYRDIRDEKHSREVQAHLERQERLAAVGQLAAGIAHDFNNLLTSIIGFADLLASDPTLPEPMRPDLEAIVQEGKRGAQLVRQILDFSRASITLREPLDLRDLLANVARFWERTLPERIHIEVEVSQGKHEILGDTAQLSRMLLNLAVNARDAMPTGGVLTLRLDHVYVEDAADARVPDMMPGSWEQITLSDTGAGMPPEVMDHLYEPFFTTKEPGRGTGLGLAQVYGIVKQHGGHITASSRVGQGTAFCIYLPSMPTGSLACKVKGPQNGQKANGAGETILLVEDEEVVLSAGRALLTKLGYRVLTANDGVQALAMYGDHRDEVRLVISDLVMPNMGGAQLYRYLVERDPGLRMIVTTGYLDEGESHELFKEGAVRSLLKPYTMDDMAAAVRQALSD